MVLREVVSVRESHNRQPSWYDTYNRPQDWVTLTNHGVDVKVVSNLRRQQLKEPNNSNWIV